MLKVIQNGDIFENYYDTNALVNPINCVGISGAGLALQFKREFPNSYFRYKKYCEGRKLQLGGVFFDRVRSTYSPLFIIYFPTKHHWKNDSLLANIDLGLDSLVKEIKHINVNLSLPDTIKSIRVPALGCGLGGLKEENVFPLIENMAKQIPNVFVEFYSAKEGG